MMRKLIFGLILSAVALVGRADWLYWTLDYSDTESPSSPWSGAGSSVPKTAWLSVVDGSGNATAIASSFEGGTPLANADLAALSQVEDMSRCFTTLDNTIDWTGYTFFVELGESLGSANWRSEALSYALAQSKEYMTKTMMSTGLNSWSPTSWAAIPEPSSGLLMLIGVAGLALRRRRRV